MLRKHYLWSIVSFNPNFNMKNFLFLFAILCMTVAPACSSDNSTGNSDSDNTENNSDSESNASSDSENDKPASIQDAMNQVQDAMKQLNDGEEVEVVNFRELQKMMPEKVDGYERTSKGGETAGAMGMNVSTAEATYEKDGQKIELNIIDTGGLGMAMMGIAAWSTVTVDREDENGYERTGKLDGYKSYEKFRKNGGKSQVSVIVDDRFIIQAEARIKKESQMDELRDLIKEVDPSSLSKMK